MKTGGDVVIIQETDSISVVTCTAERCQSFNWQGVTPGSKTSSKPTEGQKQKNIQGIRQQSYLGYKTEESLGNITRSFPQGINIKQGNTQVRRKETYPRIKDGVS